MYGKSLRYLQDEVDEALDHDDKPSAVHALGAMSQCLECIDIALGLTKCCSGHHAEAHVVPDRTTKMGRPRALTQQQVEVWRPLLVYQALESLLTFCSGFLDILTTDRPLTLTSWRLRCSRLHIQTAHITAQYSTLVSKVKGFTYYSPCIPKIQGSKG
jgi:hypothetical protein